VGLAFLFLVLIFVEKRLEVVPGIVWVLPVPVQCLGPEYDRMV
jgi:hypothetical protein